MSISPAGDLVRGPVEAEFSRALRERRTALGVSQLDLAMLAGTTQRHLSFVESGRSAPGRDLVLRLTRALGLSLRETNRLLLTAGYAPAFTEGAIDSDDLAPAVTALRHIAAAHMPYPAIVVDRRGDVVVANDAFSWLLGPTPSRLTSNAYLAALHPEGLASRIVNFEQWSCHVIHNLETSLARSPDGRLSALLDELRTYASLPEVDSSMGFAVPMRLRTGGVELRLMTTVSTFATATDVTLSELKLEAFLPADPETSQFLHAVATRQPIPRFP